jgi:hypothetical protein
MRNKRAHIMLRIIKGLLKKIELSMFSRSFPVYLFSEAEMVTKYELDPKFG